MKRHPHLGTGLAAGALFLIGTLAVAQTAPQAKTGSAQGSSGSHLAGLAVDHAGGNGVRRADTGNSGNNPLYEGKDQANLKPGTGASTAQYKDPEDMTTRYRPGNNKTTRSASNATAEQSAQGSAQRKSGSIVHSDFPVSTDRNSVHTAESQQRKHIAGVKYEDRAAATQGSAPNKQ